MLNSLKNMFLPTFVDSIDPLEFLFIKFWNYYNMKVFGIMAKDKENNIYVYHSLLSKDKK